MLKERDKRLFDDHLHPAHLAVLQPHLDAVWMGWGTGQQFFDDAARPLAGALVVLEDDVHGQAGAYVFPMLSVHGYPSR
ncbi:MAG: hypothetical protein QG666_557, partial [Euryarchaeota archaeon]|nr:hypothetical protein [Euryarchaeota archaeon]